MSNYRKYVSSLGLITTSFIDMQPHLLFNLRQFVMSYKKFWNKVVRVYGNKKSIKHQLPPHGGSGSRDVLFKISDLDYDNKIIKGNHIRQIAHLVCGVIILQIEVKTRLTFITIPQEVVWGIESFFSLMLTWKKRRLKAYWILNFSIEENQLPPFFYYDFQFFSFRAHKEIDTMHDEFRVQSLHKIGNWI